MPLNIRKSPSGKKCTLPSKKLPATVLCGFLGSGKTTLLNYILNNQQHGYRIAIIVNDMSEISIDTAVLRQGQAMLKRTEEKFVELANGCICCTLREDLVKEVSRLAKRGKFDYLLIESTGMAEPLPIAQAFSFETDNGKTLYDTAKIDTMVTVVDAFNFFKELNSIETHSEVKSSGKDNQLQEIPIAQLFIDQIEFATVIIINKTDLVDAEQLKSVENLVRRLNPKAEILFAQKGVVPLDKILNTKKFDFEEAQNTAKWIAELAKAPTSEIEEYGISSFAYKRRRPFNPEKFFDLMNDQEILRDVIRGKGYIWIATNMIICASINIVSGNKILEPETIWWASIKQSKWGDTKKEIDVVKKHVKEFWEAKYGDRRNEMIFIGRKLDKDEIIRRLDECLLTDEEFELGEVKWASMFKDPFPEWQKAVKNHPLRKNFKCVEDEWEEVESDEEELNVTNNTSKSTRSNTSERSQSDDEEEEEEEEEESKGEEERSKGGGGEKKMNLNDENKKKIKTSK